VTIIKEFESNAKFPVLAVLIFILVFGYVDYNCIIVLTKFPSLFSEIFGSNSNMLVLADIGILFVGVFSVIVLAWFNIGIIYGFVQYVRMIGVSLTILDEGIKIKGRSKEAFIPNSSIKHISRSANKRSLFIAWNGAKDIMTFAISHNVFGMQAVNEAISILKEKDVYIDDQEQALKIRKGIKKFRSILFLPFSTLCDIEDGIEK
jgi:hypothetical protein